jgi:hypothetical protein
MKGDEVFVGLDVAKRTLDVAVRPTGKAGRWRMARAASAS